MQLKTLFQALSISLLCAGNFCLSQPYSIAQVSFQQALSDYNAGRYARALSELRAYEASYPNNALVHYYVALCQQATGHIDEAKTEFNWVATRGDGNLKSMAAAGLAQLAHAHGSMSMSTSSHSTQIASAMPTAAAPAQQGHSKVKKIIEFYADW